MIPHFIHNHIQYNTTHPVCQSTKVKKGRLKAFFVGGNLREAPQDSPQELPRDRFPTPRRNRRVSRPQPKHSTRTIFKKLLTFPHGQTQVSHPILPLGEIDVEHLIVQPHHVGLGKGADLQDGTVQLLRKHTDR